MRIFCQVEFFKYLTETLKTDLRKLDIQIKHSKKKNREKKDFIFLTGK